MHDTVITTIITAHVAPSLEAQVRQAGRVTGARCATGRSLLCRLVSGWREMMPGLSSDRLLSGRAPKPRQTTHSLPNEAEQSNAPGVSRGKRVHPAWWGRRPPARLSCPGAHAAPLCPACLGSEGALAEDWQSWVPLCPVCPQEGKSCGVGGQAWLCLARLGSYPRLSLSPVGGPEDTYCSCSGGASLFSGRREDGLW